MKKVGDEMLPAFAISVGGSDTRGGETLAAPGEIIAVNDIPKLLVDIAEAVSAENTTYDKWIDGHEAALRGIIEKYA